MTMTYMHINYFEAGYCLEDAFRLAKEIGYDGIELRDRDRSGELALKDYLQLTDKLRKQFQLSVIYGCRLDTTHRDAVVRNQSLDDCLEVIRFAGEMGVETLNLFAGSLIGEQPMLFSQQGSALADESVYQQAAPMLKQVAAVAREYGMTLCLETHNGYMHDLAKPAAELVDRLGDPNLKVNFDFGNILLNRNGETLDDAIQILGGRIGYVHSVIRREPEAIDVGRKSHRIHVGQRGMAQRRSIH